MTTITLTDYEAEQFIIFQKHRNLFAAMQEAGVFNIGFGKAIINIANKEVMNITTEIIAWKK
jgi:hypothetical protein